MTDRIRHSFLRMTALLALTVILPGCAAHEKTAQTVPDAAAQEDPFKDPGDAQFMRAIAEYVAMKNAPANTRYEFTRLDLNKDGRREGMVLLKTPHAYWCGAEGCTMAVFMANNDSFTLVSEIAPVRGPLTVSKHATNGWRDIMIRISGRMDKKTKDVALRFDGREYPAHPPAQPPVLCAWNDLDGVRIFP